jgi:radical SAM superfamily enzyme YgiQ (UPF0313 family)
MAGRSAESVTRWLDANLHRFDLPGQYLGSEPNAVRRSWDESGVRVLLAASWDYSQAAGNIAIPALYSAVHAASPAYLADRFYLPATQRDLSLLERSGVPVFGIESKHPLADFDVVGTSISYTVLFMNACKLLSMSGIPLRWKDRTDNAGDYPMVMVGGQAYRAPEFMSPVFDCVWLGEAEDEPGNPGGIGDVLAEVEQFKKTGAWRAARIGCYEHLARTFPHLYFPRFTEFSYRYEDRGLPEQTKMVAGFRSVLEGVPDVHRARKIRDLDAVKPLLSSPVLFSDPTMGSGDIEVARGCPAWCTMCALTYAQKPYRQHSVAYSLEQAKTWRKNMGSTEISLVAPDPPMHTAKKALISGLLENVTGNVDASSMRIDDYIADPDFSMLMSVSGTSSITLGLEGNSQRMRDLAGKGASDEEVIAAVTRAISAGVRKIKLYMITNWPGEEAGDTQRIVDLGRKLADVRNGFGPAARGVQLIFSWTPLLLEAATPLQWFEVTAPDYHLQKALDELREQRIWVKIGSKASPPKLAFFQACQRASRDAGEAITDVMEELGTASWGGFAKDMRERLDAAMARHGFRNGLDDIFGERFQDDLLGWEHISTGVARSLLWRVYRDMVRFLEGTDAETYDEACGTDYHGQEWVPRCDQQCSGTACGVCSREDLELRRDYVQAAERDLSAEPVTPVDHTSVSFRLRLRVERPRSFRFVSNDSLAFILRRAAYGACEETGFPPVAAETFKLASDPVAYRDRSAGMEYAEFGVTRPATDEQVRKFLSAMAAGMYPWLEWPGQYQRLSAAARLPARPASLWELEVDESPEALDAMLRRWEHADSVPVLLKSDSFYVGAVSEHADARDHVGDFWVLRDGQRLILRMTLTGRLGPYQAYAALAGTPGWIDAAVRTATRVDFFGGEAGSCARCGGGMPENLLGEVWPGDRCPRCADEEAGKIVAGLDHTGV